MNTNTATRPKAIVMWLQSNLDSKEHIEKLMKAHAKDKAYVKAMLQELVWIRNCITKARKLIRKYHRGESIKGWANFFKEET